MVGLVHPVAATGKFISEEVKFYPLTMGYFGTVNPASKDADLPNSQKLRKQLRLER